MTIIQVPDTSQWCSVTQKWKQIPSTSIPVKNLGANLSWDVSCTSSSSWPEKRQTPPFVLSYSVIWPGSVHSSSLTLSNKTDFLNSNKVLRDCIINVINLIWNGPFKFWIKLCFFSVRLQKYPSGSSRLQNILEIITALASRELTYKKNRLCYNKHLLNGCNKIKQNKSKFKPTSWGQEACLKIHIKGRKQNCLQSD